MKAAISINRMEAALAKAQTLVEASATGWIAGSFLFSGLTDPELDTLTDEGMIRWDDNGTFFTLTANARIYSRFAPPVDKE